MPSDVLGSRNRFEIVEPVVHRVFVDVVDDVPAFELAVLGLPHGDCSRFPHVRFLDLDPCSRVVAPMRTRADCPDRHPIVCSLAGAELRAWGTAYTGRCRFEIAGSRSGARIRAVVHRAAFCGPSVERLPADRTHDGRQRRALRAEGARVLIAARARTEDQAASTTGDPIRPDREDVAAMATGDAHGLIVTGTTLQVAVAHGRDAVGVDLDERNAVLAVERCGMFLSVEHVGLTERTQQ